MKKRTLATTLTAGILAAALCIGGSMAYLTDSKEAINKFQIGEVKINLEEPNWKETDNQNLTPTQVIKKDPQITNTGSNDAFVYLEVSIPMENVVTANTDGTRKNNGSPAYQEIFSFQPNQAWSQISKKENDKNQMVYIYSYNQIIAPQVKTTPLFEQVVFANVIEGQIDNNQFDIGVRAYAIQSDNTGDKTSSVPEQAKQAFEKYVNQNKNQSGAATY